MIYQDLLDDLALWGDMSDEALPPPARVARRVADLYQKCGCCGGTGTGPVPCPDQAQYPKNTFCTVAHYGPCSACGGSGAAPSDKGEAVAGWTLGYMGVVADDDLLVGLRHLARYLFGEDT